MHRANFLALGIEASYELKQVLNLEKEMKDLKQLDGFNVTLPYKQMIIPFLDDVDPIAKAIGAVNTVKNVNGKLMGYNTDVDGFFESFQGFSPLYVLLYTMFNIYVIRKLYTH